jgi:glycosyltransferase involved in cell wall biosynthesis
MVKPKFVLVTAAHNEDAFIERTCESVVNQVVRPTKWIVVDDASTDRTSDIVARYQNQYPGVVELLRITRPPGRDFRNKVRAFEMGLAYARKLDYAFIGNLDADISFSSDYFAKLLSRFTDDTRLGIAGGTVCSSVGDRFVSQNVAADSVAGAVQLFRRECFDEIGGYLALPQGGIDAAAEIMARKAGWGTRTFFDLPVYEHRRTGTATATPLSARRREGVRMYSLGYGLAFFLARCLRRSLEQPRVVGSAVALLGYLGAMVRRDPMLLPPDVVAYLRAEQRQKLLSLLRGRTDRVSGSRLRGPTALR